MIYTLTLNPSLDYVVTVADFKRGVVNRTQHEYMLPGGKGINVSWVLKNLGMDSHVLGFVAGFTGTEIERRIQKEGCIPDFIELEEGMSRINVKLRSGDMSEINAAGPDITKEAMERLYQKLDSLAEGDVLVLAGSIPGSLPDATYYNIMEYLKGRGIMIVVDATRELLRNVLPLQPFLIKPNHHELGELFDADIRTREDVKLYGRKMQEMGARNVLVSMGGAGAVLLTEEGTVYEGDAPDGIVKNAVGAGDSMVAGFLYGYLTTGDYEYALKMGLCCGSASAFSEELATKEEVERLMSYTK